VIAVLWLAVLIWIVILVIQAYAPLLQMGF
jgi:hypothetical protein